MKISKFNTSYNIPYHHDFVNQHFTSNHRNIQIFCPHLKSLPIPSSSTTFTGRWPTKVTLPLPKESLQNLKLSNLPLTSSSENATPKSPMSSQVAISASVPPSFLSQTASCPPFPPNFPPLLLLSSAPGEGKLRAISFAPCALYLNLFPVFAFPLCSPILPGRETAQNI